MLKIHDITTMKIIIAAINVVIAKIFLEVPHIIGIGPIRIRPADSPLPLLIIFIDENITSIIPMIININPMVKYNELISIIFILNSYLNNNFIYFSHFMKNILI